MAFSIKNPETDRLARRLAKATGESLTIAVNTALRERLERVKPKKSREETIRQIKRITAELAAIPDVDTRPMDDLLYGDDGAPN